MSAEGELSLTIDTKEVTVVPEPQAPPPSAADESVITTVKEQVIIKKTEPVKQPSASPVRTDQETRPRKPKSSQPAASTPKGGYSESQTTKTSKVSSTSTKTYGKSTRDHGDWLGIESLAREFRGTSPSVLENIATHPLLFNSKYEPLRNPGLSAKSKKAIRDASDLALTAPGLKGILEVQ